MVRNTAGAGEMLEWLSKLFGRSREAAAQRRVTSPVRVRFDDKIVTVDEGSGLLAMLAWADLANVALQARHAVPPDADLVWILAHKDGRQALTIPMGADGEGALVAAMQARLPDFDNMAVVEAMSSAGDGMFQVWPAAALI